MIQLSVYEQWSDEPFTACENPDVPMGKWLLQHLPEKPPKILDVGCGTGLHTDWCNRQGIETWGITINHAGWDHHAKIFTSLDKKLPEFDWTLSGFLDDLRERGLLDTTLLAVFGEFGRTPTLNKDAGRDHWGKAGSLLFAGAGVKNGLVLGATDKLGAYPTRRPVSPPDVAATLLTRLGVDPQRQIITPDGRPLEILDQGEPVRELFT